MIKVNLAQKKKAPQLSQGGGGLASFLSGLGLKGSSPSGASDTKSFLVSALVAGAIGYGASWVADDYRIKELAIVQDEVQQVQARISKLDSELAKTQGFQVLKRKLEDDEKAIRLKIDTIEKLMAERRDPPQILKTLSEVTPKEIWLTDFELKSQAVRIAGNSRGLVTVSDFMKTLEETVYFKEVELKKSTSKREAGVDTSTFELEAKRK